MNSGLMQILAFCHEKGQKESGPRYEIVATHLRDWLHQQCGTPAAFDAFMEELFKMQDARRFQTITTEAFAWLK